MFDPDVERLLAAIAFKQAPSLEQLGPTAARQMFRESCTAFSLPPVALSSVADRTTPDGHALGYLPAEDGDLLAHLLDAGGSAIVRVRGLPGEVSRQTQQLLAEEVFPHVRRLATPGFEATPASAVADRNCPPAATARTASISSASAWRFST